MRGHARRTPGQDCACVFPQEFELLVQGDCQANCGGGKEKFQDVPAVIIKHLVIGPRSQQQPAAGQRSEQQRVADFFSAPFIDGSGQLVAPGRQEQPEAGAGREYFTHVPSSSG